VKAVFKALKRNGFTAVLPDHVPDTSGGIMAPFFGINTLTGTMVPKLVQRTGARAVMMYCMRKGDGFEIFFEAPDPDIYTDNLAMATAAMNRSVESVIATDPVQYQWSYKRFKRNETLPDPYGRQAQ
jgi:KDO2-lipid IV(A) lauroyltransferase